MMVYLLISLSLFGTSFCKTLPVPSPQEQCELLGECYDPINKECSHWAPCPKIDYCNGPLTQSCPAYPDAQCRFNGCGGCNTYFVDITNQIIEDCDANICTFPPETGLCKAAFKRYYFNDETQQCEKFIYGGCGGNANNFKTLDECEKACGIDICSLQSETGPCDAYIPRYFYNNYAGKCEQFVYGGCKGNDNNFKTISDCERTCPSIPNCVPKHGSFMGDPKKCTRIDFICSPDEEYWFDQKCGCGCKPKEITKDCSAVSCLKPICGAGEELYTPKDQCCPKCFAEGYNCGFPGKQCDALRAPSFLCPDDITCYGNCGICSMEKNKLTGKLECSALIPKERVCDIDCSKILCAAPDCGPGEELYTPEDKCCPQCIPCDEVNCFIEPCKFSSCDNFPDAICENNYCNGCNAIWSDSNGNDVTNQCKKTTTTTEKPDCVPDGWNYIGNPSQCAAIRFICVDGYETWFNECGCGCKPKEIIINYKPKCEIAGCSGQICAENAKDIITTCEWRCEYGCRKLYKTCGKGISGNDICQWFFEDDTSMDAYNKCVNGCSDGIDVM